MESQTAEIRAAVESLQQLMGAVGEGKQQQASERAVEELCAELRQVAAGLQR